MKLRKECTGCSACKQACPMGAIEMSVDSNGFIVPIVNDKCISCHLCEKVCPIDVPITHREQKVFSFINSNKNILIDSSSGGVFPAVAEYILSKNGIVFGCVLDENNNAIHKSATTMDGVKSMQGSKYVQSNIGNTYKEAKECLKEGRFVLFTGTPCQIHGLYTFLNDSYPNLLTIDIICHGVPNQVMLSNELKWMESNASSNINNLLFRDKKVNGWNLVGSVNANGGKKLFYPANNPYYYYFDRGSIYRDSCYTCKYACLDRIGDLTIGDFWGIEKFKECKTRKISNGVSLVIANSSKGLSTMNVLRCKGEVEEYNLSEAIVENLQLIQPVSEEMRDDEIINFYNCGKVELVYKRFFDDVGSRMIAKKIKALMPIQLKLVIKGMSKYEK